MDELLSLILSYASDITLQPGPILRYCVTLLLGKRPINYNRVPIRASCFSFGLQAYVTSAELAGPIKVDLKQSLTKEW